jgi:hypothetical protein
MTINVNDFMNENLESIKTIIEGIPTSEFDSHEFIRRFAKEFEVDYVKFLSMYDAKPFKTVHAQIAINLLHNKIHLRIEDSEKTTSANVFGIEDQNEQWIKKP